MKIAAECSFTFICNGLLPKERAATESSEYCSKAMFNDTERDLKCGSAESVDIESSRIMRIGIPPFNL